jgi:hypothetical protein
VKCSRCKTPSSVDLAIKTADKTDQNSVNAKQKETNACGKSAGLPLCKRRCSTSRNREDNPYSRKPGAALERATNATLLKLGKSGITVGDDSEVDEKESGKRSVRGDNVASQRQ